VEATAQELESLRREVKSELGRVEGVLGTQIGAVEKTLQAELGGLKWKFLGSAAVQLIAALAVLVSARPAARDALDALEAILR